MQKRLASFTTVVGLVAMAMAPAQAHHSNSAFEVEKIIELKGVVKDWRWVNPHTWITLVVDDGRGGTVEWEVEGRAPGILGRAGWTKNSIKVGDSVTIHCSPAKDGSKLALVARVTLADGTVLANAPPPVQ